MTTPAAIADALELKPEAEAELHRLLRMYRRESDRCRKSEAHLAACIMSGAALEVTLILAVSSFSDEAAATGKLPKKKNITKPLLQWNLAELLAVAKAAGWLPAALKLTEEWDRRRAKIGDYAEVIRMLRNLLHPARYIEDNFKKRITKKHSEFCNEIFAIIIDVLLAKIGDSIKLELEKNP
jgi:hypothetical protein